MHVRRNLKLKYKTKHEIWFILHQIKMWWAVININYGIVIWWYTWHLQNKTCGMWWKLTIRGWFLWDFQSCYKSNQNKNRTQSCRKQGFATQITWFKSYFLTSKTHGGGLHVLTSRFCWQEPLTLCLSSDQSDLRLETVAASLVPRVKAILVLCWISELQGKCIIILSLAQLWHRLPPCLYQRHNSHY